MSKIGTLIIAVAEYFDVSTDQVTEDMVKKYISKAVFRQSLVIFSFLLFTKRNSITLIHLN